MAKKKINLNIYGLSIINNENKRVLLNSLDEGKSYICLLYTSDAADE